MAKRRFVDLHTHSIASDGSCTPTQVVQFAEQAGLAALALTDHDTVVGLDEACRAAAGFPDLVLVPGIEISAAFATGTLHILGLGIDAASPSLAELTRHLQDARSQRNPQILQKLSGVGINISMEEVLATAESFGGKEGLAKKSASDSGTRILGRLHIARTLVRKGHVRTIDEAFNKYLGRGQFAYVDKERLSPSEAIGAIHNSGGLAVLAHPPQLKYENNAQLLRILRDLIHAGLDGIEAYHAENTPQQTRQYVELACQFNLGITGGSDFHGMGKPHVKLGLPKVSVESLGSRFADKLLGR